MSDVDIVLDEIDALRSLVSALCYKATITVDLLALQHISHALDACVEEILREYPDLA
jgi:hypothetical protein